MTTRSELQWVSDLLRTMQEEMAQARAEVERLTKWTDDLQSGMYVNCVYCGHRYGPKETTPVSMADALKAHVEQCPKHPMSALRARLEAAERSLEHTRYWYSCRFATLADWFRNEGKDLSVAKQFWDIYANGSTEGHPPTYAQQYNLLKHRAERAEQERDSLLEYLHATTDQDGTHHRDWVADCQTLEHDAERLIERCAQEVADLIQRHEHEATLAEACGSFEIEIANGKAAAVLKTALNAIRALAQKGE